MNTPTASTQRTVSVMPETIRVEKHPNGTMRKILLYCGILSSLWYVAINIIIPMQYPGYNSASQTVSELSAIGAPTRVIWMILATPYTLLIIAFSWGIWKSADSNRHLRIAGSLLVAYGALGIL